MSRQIISYMAIANEMNNHFWQLKKGLENDLKPILESKGSIEFENPLYINFYGIGSIFVNKIIIDNDYGVSLYCEDNVITKQITEIRDIDDCCLLCTELGM
jgi:hypothetical protein